MWETWVWSLGREDPLEKELATHSSILAWRILWTEESGELQSIGSQSDMTERLTHSLSMWSKQRCSASAYKWDFALLLLSGTVRPHVKKPGVTYRKVGGHMKQKQVIPAAAAAAKALQSCPTLCDPRDGGPPGSPVPGILQARTLEWVAISFFNAWKWKVKVKSLSWVRLLANPWTAADQAPPSVVFSGKNTGVGCYCLLQIPAKAR